MADVDEKNILSGDRPKVPTAKAIAHRLELYQKNLSHSVRSWKVALEQSNVVLPQLTNVDHQVDVNGLKLSMDQCQAKVIEDIASIAPLDPEFSLPELAQLEEEHFNLLLALSKHVMEPKPPSEVGSGKSRASSKSSIKILAIQEQTKSRVKLEFLERRQQVEREIYNLKLEESIATERAILEAMTDLVVEQDSSEIPLHPNTSCETTRQTRQYLVVVQLL